MQNVPNLAKAVIAVMVAVKGIDKTMVIGTGSNSYKGVSDQEVKKIIGDAMQNNGLCILPIAVDSKIQIDRWEAAGYNGGSPVQKQSVFTEVTTKYLLLHESGESIELSGYGQGIDTQDKGAGKATTYALKYALLYTFMVPTGKIEDTDNTHSENLPIAPPKQVSNLSDADILKRNLAASIGKLNICKNLSELKIAYAGLSSEMKAR
jgi:hypothetical protein